MQSFKEVYEKYRGNRSDAAVAEKANLYKATLARIKAEEIAPNRNYLWSLALALELTVEEADELFAACGLCLASQYHLNRSDKDREIIIVECLNRKKFNVVRLNIRLYESGYRLLGNRGLNEEVKY